jgi:hypothetical protein
VNVTLMGRHNLPPEIWRDRPYAANKSRCSGQRQV